VRLERAPDERAELIFSEEGGQACLEDAAKQLTERCGAVLLEKVDGLDQSYWDFELGGAKVTLHREHYLGVWLCAADDMGEEAVLAAAKELGAG
jgi:hypothetical protein